MQTKIILPHLNKLSPLVINDRRKKLSQDQSPSFKVKAAEFHMQGKRRNIVSEEKGILRVIRLMTAENTYDVHMTL